MIDDSFLFYFAAMKRRSFLKQTALVSAAYPLVQSLESFVPVAKNPVKKLFVTGGAYDLATIKFLASLTGKQNPKICFLPTPVGDSEAHINRWFAAAKLLPIQPFVQKVFITSGEQKTSFEETLLQMDAILVTGGNTLNAITLWKAHGIDNILRKAWEKGIVLSGPSAGAICWFDEGLSDSRPIHLTKVEGLHFLKGSMCPHYHTEKERRPILLDWVEKEKIMPGYALDETAGLYFENETLKRVVAQNATDKAYRLTLKGGKVQEEVMAAELLPGE